MKKKKPFDRTKPVRLVMPRFKAGERVRVVGGDWVGRSGDFATGHPERGWGYVYLDGMAGPDEVALVNLKRDKAKPWTCQICGEGNDKNPARKKVVHHISYQPEITRVLCLRCHLRLHGLGRCFNHPFEKKYGRDGGPVEFARAVIRIYDRADCPGRGKNL